MADPMVTVLQPQVIKTVLSVGQGPAGPQGPAGEYAPGSGDLHYVHTQSSAASVWSITHNLGKYPAVVVIDSAATSWEGDVAYTSTNGLTITFSAPFSGVAYLN